MLGTENSLGRIEWGFGKALVISSGVINRIWGDKIPFYARILANICVILVE
jgi:hypothetical protein